MTQQLRDPGYNNPSSPHSSSGGGADSYQQDGTPTTNLTTFSPEDGSTRVSNDPGNTTSAQSHLSHQLFHSHHAQRHNGNVSGTVTSSQDKDPFTTSQSEKHLSPTALAFRPVGPVVVHGSLNHSIHTTQSGQQHSSPSGNIQQQSTTQTTYYPRSSETDKRHKIDTAPAYHKGQFSFEQGLSHYLGFFPRRLADVQVKHIEAYLKVSLISFSSALFSVNKLTCYSASGCPSEG